MPSRVNAARPSAKTAPLLSTVWRGCVNAWECDEMGHMNVRFYLAKWSEAMGATAAAMAAPGAFRANAASTILPRDQHVRFHAEGRPGAPLSMSAGVIDFDACEARLVHEMRHEDGRPAATFVTRVRHAEARSGETFPWSKRTLSQLETLLTQAPAHALPRSVDLERSPAVIDRAQAERLNLPIIGQGMAMPPETDAFGRVRPDFFIGRISDSVPNLLSAWRQETARTAGERDGVARAPGAAVVEFRLIYRAWPQAGDLFEVRSGIAEVGEKTQRLVHWMFDPTTGQPWFSGEAVALTFDLITRKTITPNAEQREALTRRITPGLAP